MVEPHNSAANCNYSAEHIQRAACGQWPQIHTDLTQIPPALLAGGDHPCPICGGTDRFNVNRDSYEETGQIFCKPPCELHGKHGIAVVQAMNKISFPEACAAVGEWLIEKGLCSPADLIDRSNVAQQKNERIAKERGPNSKRAGKEGPAQPQMGADVVLPKPRMKDGKPHPRVHEKFSDAVSGMMWYQSKKGLSSTRPPDQAFVYESAPGRVVFVVVRWNLTEQEREASVKTKIISQIARVEGGWQSGNPYRERPLYGLFNQPGTVIDPEFPHRVKYPDLPDVSTAEEVFLCEGETSAEALCEIGLVGISPSQGANSPQLTDFRPLNGKKVVLCPDHDTDGEKFIQVVREILSDHAPDATIQVRCFADDPDFGGSIRECDDAFDWRAFHKDKSQAEMRAILDGLPDRSAEERFAPRAPTTKKGNGTASCLAF